jgi:hypothetical protein
MAYKKKTNKRATALIKNNQRTEKKASAKENKETGGD